MKQPARSREAGQRLTREELAPASGLGRMAEIGALATAASAMAIGVLNAREHPDRQIEDGGSLSIRHPAGATDLPPASEPAGQDQENASGHATRDQVAPDPDHPASGELVSSPDSTPNASLPALADMILDPSVLIARIAEQIATSVSHILDMAAGGDGTPATLSRDIVEQAQQIAHDVHGQFAVMEPLAVLADLVPQSLALDTIGTDIIHSVDAGLSESGVMDLLHGAVPDVDPERIVDGIVADLHGLNMPIDLASIATAAPVDIGGISGALLGGTDLGHNPLAELFYDDGGAEVTKSVANSAANDVSNAVTDIPKIGFLAQPLDLGDELGGLTNGHNALQLL